MGLPYVSVSPALGMWEAAESIEGCCGMERWPWSWTVLVRKASWGGTDDLRVFLTHVPAILGVCCMAFCSSPCRYFPESATSSCKWPRNEGSREIVENLTGGHGSGEGSPAWQGHRAFPAAFL